MDTRTVIFEAALHHVCLMHGLKQTYGRMPFLNKRVLEIRGRVMTIDNVVAPPPMMNNPSRRTSFLLSTGTICAAVKISLHLSITSLRIICISDIHLWRQQLKMVDAMSDTPDISLLKSYEVTVSLCSRTGGMPLETCPLLSWNICRRLTVTESPVRRWFPELSLM